MTYRDTTYNSMSQDISTRMYMLTTRHTTPFPIDCDDPGNTYTQTGDTYGPTSVGC